MGTNRQLRKIQDVDIRNKTVLYRSPYDIGVEEIDGELVLTDDSRMVASIPTLTYLLERDCKIVVLTYVKRPQGIEEKLRTNPHAKHLSDLLNRPVQKLDDCIGDMVRTHISNMKSGDIVMLENTRFYSEDNDNDDSFARELAQNGEIIVFDGFPQAHRSQASVTGIMGYLPSYAGLYFQKEYEALSNLLEEVKHPFTVIIGGAKISDKTEAINNLYEIADSFLLGGGVANVFIKAQGREIGGSYLEERSIDTSESEDWVGFAHGLLQKDTDLSLQQKIHVPQDVIIGQVDSSVRETHVISFESDNTKISKTEAIYDIGPVTLQEYISIIDQSKTVFWNGPLGLTEDERFNDGSIAIAKVMEKSSAQTILAGGDTIDVVNDVADLSKFSHVSLAGGATLEFLAGKKLAPVELLLEYS